MTARNCSSRDPVRTRTRMLRTLAALLVAGACACSDSSLPAISAPGKTFEYKDYPVSKSSAATGPEADIKLSGQSLALLGTPIRVGQTLRDAALTALDNSLLNLANSKGRVRVISIVPSLDTPVCEQQTHYLSERSAGLAPDVELITVSIDTPFAQDRFARDANIKNVTFLSDNRAAEFGLAHGLLVDTPHVLARAMMVVDQQNVIRYLQVTPEIVSMPDMDAALSFARQLVAESKVSKPS